MDFRLDHEILADMGGKVRGRRLSFNMSQKELSLRAQVNVNTVAKMEKEAGITLPNYLKLCRVLGMDMWKMILPQEESYSPKKDFNIKGAENKRPQRASRTKSVTNESEVGKK